jgi:hypothetical protein
MHSGDFIIEIPLENESLHVHPFIVYLPEYGDHQRGIMIRPESSIISKMSVATNNGQSL